MTLRLLGTFLLGFLMNSLSAQNLNDAFRYSFQNPLGSARYNATSGAMNAIGADITTGSHNPAGIAAFWKSEFALTGNMGLLNTDANFIEANRLEKTATSESTISNGGIVFTTYSPNKNWMAKSFSISYNKLMDYNRETYFEGRSLGSIGERWAGLADGLNPDDLDNFEAGIAYDAGVIYDREGDYLYEYDYFRHEDQELDRNQIIQEEGGWNEVAFTFGGNYKNKVLIGATLGLDFIRYESEKYYTEFNEDKNAIPFFDELRFQEFLSANGIGINAKLGAIVKITPVLHWSVFASSPTVFSFSENYRNIIDYSWQNNSGAIDNAYGDSGEAEGEYQFSNPWKISTGLGYILGKNGFIDAEIDYVGYNFSKFEFENALDRDFENFLNRDIDNNFENVINFRIGGEYVFQTLRFRAGYHFYGSPLADISNTVGYSAGIGYRGNNWFLDFAYLHQSRSTQYNPYVVEGAIIPSVDLDKKVGNLSLTIGFKL